MRTYFILGLDSHAAYQHQSMMKIYISIRHREERLGRPGNLINSFLN